MVACGFLNPVFDSQRAFRTVMEAMANPGELRSIGVPHDLAPGLPRAAAAALLARCDFETAVYFSPSLRRHKALLDTIRFHTGSELTDDPSHAAFAVVEPVADGLNLSAFAQGTPEYPDRSTTVLALCRALDAGSDVTVKGPGVRTTNHFGSAGLPADFLQQMTANRAGFPLGVDVLLVAGDAMIGLPRSAHLTAGGH